MSEAKDAPKKKGKLPIIIVAVVLIAGGGYFAMGQGKKKDSQKEPDLILGEKVDLGDIVTPMADGKTYLECQVVVQIGEKDKLGDAGGEGAKGGPDPAARSAVLEVIKETSPKDIQTPAGMALLREHIAWQINHDVEKLKAYAKPAGDDDSGHKKHKHKSDGGDTFEHVEPKDRDNPDLDSDDGPVHVVLFPKFLPVDYGQ